jgi:hypothetical protein
MTVAPFSIGTDGRRPAFSTFAQRLVPRRRYFAFGDRISSPTPVLVTQRADRVWIAKLLTWADFSVEGDSREDALSKLDQQVKAQLADGEIAYLDLPLGQAKNPWLEIAGKYQDDPNWEEYQTAIREARQADTSQSHYGCWIQNKQY